MSMWWYLEYLWVIGHHYWLKNIEVTPSYALSHTMLHVHFNKALKASQVWCGYIWQATWNANGRSAPGSKCIEDWVLQSAPEPASEWWHHTIWSIYPEHKMVYSPNCQVRLKFFQVSIKTHHGGRPQRVRQGPLCHRRLLPQVEQFIGALYGRYSGEGKNMKYKIPIWSEPYLTYCGAGFLWDCSYHSQHCLTFLPSPKVGEIMVDSH